MNYNRNDAAYKVKSSKYSGKKKEDVEKWGFVTPFFYLMI